MHELRIAYRLLRKVSDWTLTAYLSEVYVDGEEAVSQGTPLIITPCHHNELVDVAIIAATIPHRRLVSFWAKSTSFKHPVLGPILSSSGAIPVRRNPNKVDAATSNAALFSASTAALVRDQAAIGVFPEGTSYTEPAIAQVLSGAAWAALEYTRAQGGHGQPVMIIPVGIVYTDKAKYRSRAHVEYGLPIDMTKYVPPSLFEAYDEAAERAVVKAVMKDVDEQLHKMTINAPDWDTMYAARMTRNILWADDNNVKLKDWVVVGQTLVKLFSPSEDAELASLKTSLITYFSLLHYTNITHAQLTCLVPNIYSLPSRLFIFRFIFTFLRTILNPSFLLFIPPFIAHIPAYFFASITDFLAPPGEEESRSQFKVFLGGFGTGIGAGVSSYWTTKYLSSHFLIDGGVRSKLALWSLTAWFIIKWHLLLIDSNYRRIKRFRAALKVLLGVLQPRSWDLPSPKLARYEKPPTPATNLFLKNHSPEESLGGAAWLKAQPPAIPPRMLVFHLLKARQEAVAALAKYSEGTQRPEERSLAELGGVFPTALTR
ncbi:glycerol-3-phosphate-1-acyltransferase [Mycena amicta]|nr:glycerol-3-phosphate-1-acyltransferase [Mycena amicta]